MGATKIPEETRVVHEQVTALLEEVCRNHLRPDYAVLCRKAADALARKRPSPLLSGQPRSWACGIAYAVGRNNFLFSPDHVPKVTAGELCRLFGVSPATGCTKANAVETSLKIRFLDPKWTVVSVLEMNPMIWMLKVGGVIVDILNMPREVQEIASKKGLIPRVPADSEESQEDIDSPPPPSSRNKKSPSSSSRKAKRQCGLCGNSGRLTRTECCNQPICDDEEHYVMLSYARNSCSRNHRRYTLCAYHFNEGHFGDWRDCSKCRDDFPAKIYAYFGTNEYNFVKLEKVPDCEPTRCAGCNRIVNLIHDGYADKSDGIYCLKCA